MFLLSHVLIVRDSLTYNNGSIISVPLIADIFIKTLSGISALRDCSHSSDGAYIAPDFQLEGHGSKQAPPVLYDKTNRPTGNDSQEDVKGYWRLLQS